jgi:uncharacterized protein YdeI (YjbR/CyaY-like superfamily)
MKRLNENKMTSKSKIGSVEEYLSDGCGRCSLYATPNCKVHPWKDILVALRQLVLSCGLEEEIKWSMPCYTLKGKNVLILSAFKHYAAINFFKGALIQDSEGYLEKAGENSQSARLLKISDVNFVIEHKERIRAFIFDAIRIEETGLKVKTKPLTETSIPEALQKILIERPEVAEAYEALTPGRKRSHILYITGAKQSATQDKRAEQCTSKILNGKGWLER